MNHESSRRTRLLKRILRADGVCLWRSSEGVAVPASCAPAGLLVEDFAIPDLERSSLHFMEGPGAARLLPLAVRAGRDLASPALAAFHAIGERHCGLFAFWMNREQVPYNYHEIARFALHEGEREVILEQTRQQLDRVSAWLHGLAFALPQGLALVPEADGPGLVNPAAARWLGLPPGEVDRAALTEALEGLLDRGDEPARLHAEVQAVLRGEVPGAKGHLRSGRRFTVTDLGSAAHPGQVWLLEEGP